MRWNDEPLERKLDGRKESAAWSIERWCDNRFIRYEIHNSDG